MTKDKLSFDEKKHAEKISNDILDRYYEDPDSDLSILARQFLRVSETLSKFDERIEEVKKEVEKLKVERFDWSDMAQWGENYRQVHEYKVIIHNQAIDKVLSLLAKQ